LESWPQIPPQDGLALRRYADYLVQCEKAIEKVDSLKVLNDDQEIHKMSSKLPKWALTRLGRKVYAWKNEKKRFPSFSEFVKYVVVETDIACDPMNLSQRKIEINSRGHRRQRDYGNFRRTPRESNRDEFARSLATKVNEEDASKGKTEEVQCAMCGKAHELESCNNYMDMEVKARKEFAKTKGLCFGCLGKGHLSRDCKRRKRCDSCKRAHPTSLHGDLKGESKETEPSQTENQTEQRTAYCTKSGTSKKERDGIVSSMTIPVWLQHANHPENAVLVYALLDDQSDSTFVSESTLSNLGIEGHPTQISLSTINVANEIIQTSKVNGLVVSDFRRNSEIQLPRVFSCKAIPVKRSQIPRPEMATRWSHLAKIATELSPYHSEIEVGLLIGANCPRAIVPRRVLPGRGNEPYIRTQEFYEDVANFVKRDFYVDDGLKSLKSVPEAVSIIHKTKDMLSRGGLRLHKFVSNSKDVLSTISPDDRASNLKDLDFNDGPLPVERTLGTQWCIESDSFKLRIILQLKPCTRRGILSTISSIYDPLGFAAPFLLIGRQILQDLCRDQAEWDDPVPEEVRQRWEKFRRDLLILDKMNVPRCVAPTGFEEVTSVELHHFSDASTTGYGQCSYIRLVNSEQEVHCAFIMGKSRVAPLKHITIPRLELSAALVAVKVSTMLNIELSYENIVNVFWTDSKVMLGYISNDSRRFQVFVANRVQQIRNATSPQQWNHVESEDNPANDASRGLKAEQLVEDTRWLNGPAFLWKPDLQLPTQQRWMPADDDPEVKKVKSLATVTVETKCSSMLDRLNYFSCWYRERRAIANCMNLKNRLKFRISNRSSSDKQTKSSPVINVEDLQKAESEIIQMVQEKEFPEEMKILRSLQKKDPNRKETVKIKASLKKTSCLYRLEPFLDPCGVLRVGGRLKKSDLPYHVKHPAVLPRKGHLTTLIIRHYQDCSSRTRYDGERV
jgi:hypothetical protein